MSLVDAAQPAAGRVRDLPAAAHIDVRAADDADGIAAAAVVAQTLARLGRSFRVRFEMPYGPASAADRDREPDLEILLGPGLDVDASRPPPHGRIQLDPLPALAPVQDRRNRIGPDAAAASDGVCTATVALAFAVALDERHWDLAAAALVGPHAGGDVPPRWRGWNETVLVEARRRRLVQEDVRLALEDGPLRDLLAHPPPLLAGLAESPPTTVDEFLRTHRLPPEGSLHELGRRDQETLASALTLLHLVRGRPPHELARLFAPLVLAPRWGARPYARLAQVFDASACEGEAGTALAFLLGDETAWTDLETAEARFHERQRAARRAPAPMGGVAAGSLEAWHAPAAAHARPLAAWAARRRPAVPAVVAFADAGPGVRLSARANPALATAGLHLGATLAALAQEAGGRGGGSPHAADAWVPRLEWTPVVRALTDRVAAAAPGGTT